MAFPSFRWVSWCAIMSEPIRDTMTRQEIAARDRCIIRQLRAHFLKHEIELTAEIPKIRSSVPFGFGAYDDEAVRRAESITAASLAGTESRLAQLRADWQQIVSAYGYENIVHAIEEGERRIGRLPYVD